MAHASDFQWVELVPVVLRDLSLNLLLEDFLVQEERGVVFKVRAVGLTEHHRADLVQVDGFGGDVSDGRLFPPLLLCGLLGLLLSFLFFPREDVGDEALLPRNPVKEFPEYRVLPPYGRA